MLHTFVGASMDAVRAKVRDPFIRYLESSVELWRTKSVALDTLSPREREDVLDFAFERYFQTAALFGTPESCAARIGELAALGVDEIACLMDFGVDSSSVLESLTSLDKTRLLCA